MPMFSGANNGSNPRIVFSQTLTGLNATVGPTTIFTPAATGVFRISITGFVAAVGTAGTFDLQVTNSNGSFSATTTLATFGGSVGTLTGNSYRNLMFTFNAAAGQAISWSVVFAAQTGTPSVTASVSLEQLA